MESQSDDYEIILEVLSGNANSYAEIVRRYEPRVRGYCLSVLSDPASAEDAAQDIFLKAYRALAKFRGNSSFSTWLYRIAANHCTDLLRQRARRKEESWEQLLEEDGGRIEALFAEPGAALSEEKNELLHRILNKLSEKSRQILILRELHGLNYQEIAAALECSLDAVKSRLKRSRQELQLKLRHFLKVKNV